jgi:hypothetical protein
MRLFAAQGLTDLMVVTGQRIRSLSAAGGATCGRGAAVRLMQGSLGVMAHLSRRSGKI